MDRGSPTLFWIFIPNTLRNWINFDVSFPHGLWFHLRSVAIRDDDNDYGLMVQKSQATTPPFGWMYKKTLGKSWNNKLPFPSTGFSDIPDIWRNHQHYKCEGLLGVVAADFMACGMSGWCVPCRAWNSKEPSFFIRIVSIGWWTKSLHKKWLEINHFHPLTMVVYCTRRDSYQSCDDFWFLFDIGDNCDWKKPAKRKHDNDDRMIAPVQPTTTPRNLEQDPLNRPLNLRIVIALATSLGVHW